MTQPRSSSPVTSGVLIGLITVQSFSATIFLGDLLADIQAGEFGTGADGRHFWLEAIGTLSLIAAIIVETRILMWLLRRQAHLENSLRTAQGAIQDVIDTEFAAWRLTPAEQDVANFLVKGLSTAEIARMRGSAEGTVKAQLNAIYRKSGASNRAEMLSLLIDNLMGTAPSEDGRA